ncbi:MAG: hypothetical protein QOH81_25 [Sphingomonadales bacterium]|jgi:hypothetical protein|nr:hypothetical protein [Sphingomonadales bacterium]
MIVIALAMTMAASPVAPSQERKAFGTCLSKFVHDKLEAKMDAVAFRAAAKAACAVQEAAFRNAWISYDVAMKSSRSEAAENAAAQVDDYFQNSTDTYVSSTTPAGGHHSPAANPVTPASSTTPPKP